MNGAITAITGAGTLARAIATALCARGGRVAVYHGALMTPSAEVLAESLGPARVYTHAVELDAPDALAEAVAATAAALGQPPRRAAILHDQIDGEAGGPLHLGGRSERGLARRALTANLERVYRALRALLPAMVAAGDGRIVAIDARLAERPWEGAGAALYGAAKAAALALARTAACEGRNLGVRVNAIATGALDEPDTRAVLPNLDPARWVSPRAVAAVAAFLLSDDAAGITGATIPMFGRGDNAP